jgi:hypothetical protein
VIRLAREGKLSKVRLRGSSDKKGNAQGQVFNPVEDVEALAAQVEA